MTIADCVAYGYFGFAIAGAIATPLSRRFPERKWLATTAAVCTTIAIHWGAIAAIASRGVPRAGDPPRESSAPDVTGGGKTEGDKL